jgi:hypothetical protein
MEWYGMLYRLRAWYDSRQAESNRADGRESIMQNLGWRAAALGALSCLGMVHAALAADQKRPVCLPANRIERTEIKDSQTILFHMDDRKTWANKLVDQCPGLLWDDGFIYEPTTPSDQICDNLVTIKVRPTGEVCQLGEFTLLPPTPPVTQ